MCELLTRISAPFSFWQSIYINPENLNPGDLQSIIQHEQVHITEWHTLDILLAEISVIFYWFNPGVWLMKKAVRENIEFITDRKILQKGMDSKAYQYSLLNVSFATTTSAGITNHFNFSTLKKRIKMMNAKRSSNVNLTRYAFLVPAVVVLLLIFSFSKAGLVKNGKVAYKTIVASVSNLTLPTTANHERGAAYKKITDTDKKSLTFSFKQGTDIDTKSFANNYKFFPKTDTNRKTITLTTTRERIISDTGKNSYGIIITKGLTKSIKNGVRDSVTYTINGKNATRAEFEKVAVKRTMVNSEVINVVNGDTSKIHFFGLKNFTYSKNPKNGVEYTEWRIVPDNDSTKVKELLGKMQGMEVHSDGRLTHNGVTITKMNVNGKPVTVKDFEINSPSTNERNNEQKIVKVEGQVNYPGNYIIKKDVKIPDIIIRAGGLTQSADVDESLVIVDGKEVSKKDMKKLSVDDIKSVTIKNGSDKEMRDQYGDKAKNGVLIITTKKGKK